MLKHKSEAFRTFRQWKILVENQTSKKVKRLRTDNGLELCSSEFDEFCKEQGVARHYTVRDTPQQNGVAERMNKRMHKNRVLIPSKPVPARPGQTGSDVGFTGVRRRISLLQAIQRLQSDVGFRQVRRRI